MTKITKIYVVIALIVVVLVFGIVATAVAKPKLPRPGDRAMTRLGLCDAVTSGGVVRILCENGDEFIAVEADPLPQGQIE
jgi:hypothetical protein